jgi:hypothetical protein
MVVLADEDPTMKIAIPKVFEKMQQRYCRFHVICTWSHELDRLYAAHKGLKVELEAVINSPLSLTYFEQGWNDIVNKYGIVDHPVIKALWDKRHMWIMAYFKGLYCSIITSTQKCESMNQVLKEGFVNSATSLHHFTEMMLEALQHMDHMEAGESHYSQVIVIFHGP